MRNFMKVEEIEEQRTRWIDSLHDSEICRFASSFRGGDHCTVFRTRTHGAFNVCFFVESESPPERWVVRLPLPTCVPRNVLDEKTEIELATMRYVSAKTTIPVPKVHAYAFSDSGLYGVPFIIMDYVPGRNLVDLGFDKGDGWSPNYYLHDPAPKRDKLHRQLADVYLQLRQLEFPQIGALGLPSRDAQARSCGVDEITVRHRPLSIGIVLQELDGLEPGGIFPSEKPLSTATEFVNGMLQLADNKFDQEQDQEMDDEEPASVIYAAHQFKHFVQDEWLDRSADSGPFILTHGDMENTVSNLLFDDDCNLVGVVDWEWSRVVPAQLTVPPSWLTGGNLKWVLLAPYTYNRHVRYLRAAVREREKALGLPPRLSIEWAAMETWCHNAIVAALNSPSHIYRVYWDLIFRREVPLNINETAEHERKTQILPRVRTFIEASKERQAFLEKKLRDQREFFEAEKEYYGYRRARRVRTPEWQ